MPDHLSKSTCTNYTYNSIGHVWLSDSNYSKYLLNSRNPILLIASHKGCKACCHYENYYNQIILKSNNLTLVRIDLAESVSFLQQYKMIKRFPYLLYLN